MKRELYRHQMDGVFVLLLFSIFAGCVLLVLLFGASSYEKLVKRDTDSYNQRTGISYIAAKLRHSDEANSIFVGSFSSRLNPDEDDINTIYLKLETEEDVFYTKIYYYDGYIREVLCMEDGGMMPEDGMCILPAKGLEVRRDGELVHIGVTNEDGSYCELDYYVRSHQEAYE